MIVAGEASGDLHSAKLVRALREAAGGDIEFFGCVGPRLREAEVEPIVYSDQLSIVGLPEIARALPVFLRAFRDLKKAAIERRPDVVVLVDFPDFNLTLAKSLKRAGFKIAYYISPQLWAWRKYRIRTIIKYVDLLITILPFEKDWYRKHGVEHVVYVGSPLAMQVHANTSKDEFCEKHGLDPHRPILSLLPGSRHKEISRILPEMLGTAALLSEKHSEIQFVIPVGSAEARQEVNATLLDWKQANAKLPRTLVITENETYDALNSSDAAAVTSGTATLETGIIGTPMAIVYKTSNLNYKLFRPIISVEHFGLINLIAGERLATELIQDDFTPETLASELLHLLDPSENARIRARLAEVAATLGSGGASDRAALHILNLIQ